MALSNTQKILNILAMRRLAQQIKDETTCTACGDYLLKSERIIGECSECELL